MGRIKAFKARYKPEYCQAIIDYFDTPPQRVDYEKNYYPDGTIKKETPVVLPEPFTTFEGFAHSIGASKGDILEWAEKHGEFGYAYERAMQLQEKAILVNAMSGLYNSSFAQYYGKNYLGVKDKKEPECGDNIAVELAGDIKEWAR